MLSSNEIDHLPPTNGRESSSESSSADSVQVTQFIPYTHRATATTPGATASEGTQPAGSDEGNPSSYRRLAGTSPTSMISASPTGTPLPGATQDRPATADSTSTRSRRRNQKSTPSVSATVRVMEHFALGSKPTLGGGGGEVPPLGTPGGMLPLDRPSTSSAAAVLGRSGRSGFAGLAPRRPLSARKPATTHGDSTRRGCAPNPGTTLSSRGQHGSIISPSTVVQRQKVTDNYAMKAGEDTKLSGPSPEGYSTPLGFTEVDSASPVRPETEVYIRRMAEHFRELLVYQQQSYQHQLQQVRFENSVLKKKLGDSEASAVLAIAAAQEESKRREVERKEKYGNKASKGAVPVVGERTKGISSMGGHSIIVLQEQFDRISVKHDAKLSRLNGQLEEREATIAELYKTLEGAWSPLGDAENAKLSRVMRGDGGEVSENIDLICAQIDDALHRLSFDSSRRMTSKEKQNLGDRRRSQNKHTQLLSRSTTQRKGSSSFAAAALHQQHNVGGSPAATTFNLSPLAAKGAVDEPIELLPIMSSSNIFDVHTPDTKTPPKSRGDSGDRAERYRQTGAFASPSPTQSSSSGSQLAATVAPATAALEVASLAGGLNGATAALADGGGATITSVLGVEIATQTEAIEASHSVIPSSIRQQIIGAPLKRRATLSPSLGYTDTPAAMQTDDEDLVLSYKSEQRPTISEGTQFDALQFEIYLDFLQNGGMPMFGPPTPSHSLSGVGSFLSATPFGVSSVRRRSLSASAIPSDGGHTPLNNGIILIVDPDATAVPPPMDPNVVAGGLLHPELGPMSVSTCEYAEMSDSLTDNLLKDLHPQQPQPQGNAKLTPGTRRRHTLAANSIGLTSPEASRSGSFMFRSSESPVDTAVDLTSVASTSLSVPTSMGLSRRMSSSRRHSLSSKALTGTGGSINLAKTPVSSATLKKVRVRTSDADVQCELSQENRYALLQESEVRIFQSSYAFKRALGAINSAATNLIMYTDGYAEDLMCSCCDHLYTEPQVLFACGHTFCKRCIERTMSLRVKRQMRERQQMEDFGMLAPRKKKNGNGVVEDDDDLPPLPLKPTISREQEEEEEGVYECSECQCLSREGYTPNAVVTDLVMRWNFKQRSVQEPIQTVEQLSALLCTLGQRDPVLADLSTAMTAAGGSSSGPPPPPAPPMEGDGSTTNTRCASPQRLNPEGHLDLERHMISVADETGEVELE